MDEREQRLKEERRHEMVCIVFIQGKQRVKIVNGSLFFYKDKENAGNSSLIQVGFPTGHTWRHQPRGSNFRYRRVHSGA